MQWVDYLNDHGWNILHYRGRGWGWHNFYRDAERQVRKEGGGNNGPGLGTILFALGCIGCALIGVCNGAPGMTIILALIVGIGLLANAGR